MDPVELTNDLLDRSGASELDLEQLIAIARTQLEAKAAAGGEDVEITDEAATRWIATGVGMLLAMEFFEQAMRVEEAMRPELRPTPDAVRLSLAGRTAALAAFDSGAPAGDVLLEQATTMPLSAGADAQATTAGQRWSVGKFGHEWGKLSGEQKVAIVRELVGPEVIKSAAVGAVLRGPRRSCAAIARRYGIQERTLRRWVDVARQPS